MADPTGLAPSDAELVDRAHSGDAGAFARLYDRRLSPVYRYVYYHVGSKQDAEDISATVFARAVQSLPRFRGKDCSFSTWL